MPGKGWLEVQLLAVGSASLAVQLENDTSKEGLGKYIREHFQTHLDTAMRQIARLDEAMLQQVRVRRAEDAPAPAESVAFIIDDAAILSVHLCDKRSRSIHLASVGHCNK